MSLPDPRRGQHGTAFDHELGVVEREPIVEERGAGKLARLHAGGAHDHGDETHAVAQRRGDQAKARRIGVAGLQAVDRGVALQQPVAVLLLDAVVLEFAHRKPLVVLGIFSNDGVGQQRQIPCGGEMLGRGKPRAVFEMAADHPQALGIGIHHLSKGFFGAGHPFGQGDGGIVARLHDHSQDQILNRDRFAQFDEGSRSFRTPGVLAHHHLLVKLEFADRQLLKHDVGSHELGEARRFHPRHRVLGGEDLVGPIIDHDVGASVDLGCGRDDGRHRGPRRGRLGAALQGGEGKKGQAGQEGTEHSG